MKKTYRIHVVALRMVRERTISLPHETVEHSEHAAAVAVAHIGDSAVEQVIAIVLNARGRITSIVTVSIGGTSGAACAPVNILRAVLAAHGVGFVLAHNHPSGDPTASADDISFTRKLRVASLAVGIVMLDHVVVVADGSFTSVPE